MNWYVVKYVGKCQLVPKNVWTITTKEQLYHEVNGVFTNYKQATERAKTLNKAVESLRGYKYSPEDSLSNGEPLRPLKNDIMEITDVNT